MHEHDPEHPHDHAHHAGHDPAHAYHEPAAPGSQPVSGELKDPVCGMTVTPASPHQCEFDRATYFFVAPNVWASSAWNRRATFRLILFPLR